jgi:hypothetical protein
MMSVQTEHRLPDPDDSGFDRLLDKLSGTTFEMDTDLPLVMDFGEGPIELCSFEASFLVHVHSGGDYSLSGVTLQGSTPCAQNPSRFLRKSVPLELLKEKVPEFASLIENVITAHCNDQIEEEIDRRVGEPDDEDEEYYDFAD